MKIHTLTTEMWLPRGREEVFAFFANAGNLNVLTPPWLHFSFVTPLPTTIQLGTLLEYRLRWRGLPLRWITEITAWDPPCRFVDSQRQGPYRQWVHEHTLEERDGGTWMQDHISYAVPGGLLEPLLHRFFVGPDVRRIFDFRKKRMGELFAPVAGGAVYSTGEGQGSGLGR